MTHYSRPSLSNLATEISYPIIFGRKFKGSWPVFSKKFVIKRISKIFISLFSEKKDENCKQRKLLRNKGLFSDNSVKWMFLGLILAKVVFKDDFEAYLVPLTIFIVMLIRFCISFLWILIQKGEHFPLFQSPLYEVFSVPSLKWSHSF